MSISLSQPGSGYLAIAGALRSQITRGTAAPGEQLPPISELAQRFETTAITVRRALRQLEEEGLVRVEHGVGTFVADWSRGFDLLHLPSFSEEMGARKLRSETVVLGRETGVNCPTAGQALGLEPAAPLAVLSRLRKVEDVPVAFQRSYVDIRWSAVVERCTAETSLYDALRSAGGSTALTAEERLRATILPQSLWEPLQIEGTAGWLAERTTLDAHGNPLVFDEAYFVGSRVTLRVHRRSGQALLEYEIST